ncbi:MAG: peptidoglycan-binding protein [Actinomycetota bacterium]|nr:peptidoglycan-binding protein [Actinomycetota bacterium]
MTKLIRLGDTGPAVHDIQRRLARVAESRLRVDGIYGTATLEAVRRFQRERGLPADGLVGPETWRALVEAGYALGDRLLWRSRTMMRGDDVRELQHRLNQLGFDAGPEDGIFGPLAQAAVEEFQRNVGLNVDGVAGPETVELLRGLQRQHHSGGLGVRARERESLRRLSGRGVVGARVLVDPSHGVGDPGHVGVGGAREADVVWDIGRRLAARLSARGAQALLARGPGNNPTASERARLANEQAVDVVLSIGLNGLRSPLAGGATSYYFGTSHFVSEGGRRLAELVQRAMLSAGWRPDCRTHPMTWTILRETRMPAVVAEPGFITSPDGETELVDSRRQEQLADALAGAVTEFLAHALPAAG